MTPARPLSIAIHAIGGQGGGVLTRWLVDTAEANGYLAQSTYVPGVAQRTGATVYCVEIYPDTGDDKQPVFAPYSIPGDVDLVVAGEMAETGRAIVNGFVTPDSTTVVASSHREYSIGEKSALGDGIIDQKPVAETAAALARRFVCFDMDAIAREVGCIISSVLLGAIAGSGALPFERHAFEETIRRSGRAVESNLKGFAAGYEAALGGAPQETVGSKDEPPEAVPEGPRGRALVERIETEFPAALRNIVGHGALRTLDYQDAAYADGYLDELKSVLEIDDSDRGYRLTAEVARQLALQMCYEDTIRVADLKTRESRFRRIREQVATDEDQPMHVVEFFHPRLEEVCDTLPARLGAWVLRSPRMRRVLAPLFRKGRLITTTNISGFLMLRFLARLKRWRRATYRYGVQQQRINDWLDRVREAAATDYPFAVALASAIGMVKGYGETYERGLTRYQSIVDAAFRQPEGRRAETVERLKSAALADEAGKVFEQELSRLDTEN